MAQVTFTLPTMIVDGVPTKVTIDQWAERTLSPTDLAEYQAAATRQRAIWAAAEADGEISRTYTFETLPSGKKKLTGSVTTFNGAVPPFDAKFAEFHDQFLADPALTWNN